jgi:hypothetical protein
MPYTLIYNPDLRIIESRIHGDFTLEEIREAVPKFAELIKNNNCRLVLTDHRDANMKLSTMEIYNMPGVLVEDFAASGVKVHKLKRALITTKSEKDSVFYETVTINQGQTARIFDNVDEGRNWLLGK